MKLTNVANFSTIDEYVQDKIARYEKQEKNFQTLFEFMFSERENVMAELSDGYRIKKVTYGECADKIFILANSVHKALENVPQGGIVGLYMDNGIEWIQTFWAILMLGYNPLLMNSRISADILEGMLKTYNVSVVLSDGKQFSVQTVLTKDVLVSTDQTFYAPTVWGKEVLFMSSGTSNNIKLCAYTGENFFYQVCDSFDIIKKCPQMKKHYEGELKILALLPFYHVFGFIAVYLWFGFFSRTLVFLKDLHPQTLLNTIKKHKVTHIFAVPLVWETVYKAALQKIRARGEKTYAKFEKALAIVNKHEGIGNILSKVALKEIRENLFGESICFLITGGSGISQNALQFFNGIGYHMANGYGMTEIGITSVENSMKRKVRNQASVGAAFGATEYKVSEHGELLVKGKTRASRIMQGGECYETDFSEWFNTRDLVEERNGKFYLLGRKDDLIVCKNGENINPELVESQFILPNVNEVCLFANADGVPTLLVSIANCFSSSNIRSVYMDITERLESLQLKDEVKNVVFTSDKLMGDKDFKISRQKIAKRYNEGRFNNIDYNNVEAYTEKLLSTLEQELCVCFANVLGKESNAITPEADFFTDLGGSSLDYFELIDLIKGQFNVDFADQEGKKLSTVAEFYQYIINE